MDTINSLMLDPGPDVYYTTGFRNMIEDHMTYLRTHPSTTILSIEPIRLYRFEFDLSGLLNSYNIQPYLHWIVMRMNRLKSITEVPQDMLNMLIPDYKEINKLQQTYMTTERSGKK